MSKADRPKTLTYIGPRDADGVPLEAFRGSAGEYEPIPARDLTPEETEALTEAQWKCIESPDGKRLYRGTEPETKETPSKSVSTGVKSADGSS